MSQQSSRVGSLPKTQKGLRSQAVENSTRRQKGGNPTPMSPHYYTTQALSNANNYGHLSASGVGTPVAPSAQITPPWQLGQMGGNLKIKINRKDIIQAVEEATGHSQKSVSDTIDRLYGKTRKNFTESELDQIVDAQTDSNQKGGDPTPMPWQWYHGGQSGPGGLPESSQTLTNNMTNPEMPQLSFQTVGPSGNSPNFQSNVSWQGGGGNSRIIKKGIEEGLLLKDLGTDNLVITPENMRNLFDYMYQKYPRLSENPTTATLFEDAEDDDAFIWAEMQDLTVSEIVKKLPSLALAFYVDTYPNKKEHKTLREIFSEN
jgi:hypothetical protein